MPIFYSDPGDFQVRNFTFEIGGPNQQFKDHNGKKALVKDNILIGSKNETLYIYLVFCTELGYFYAFG